MTRFRSLSLLSALVLFSVSCVPPGRSKKSPGAASATPDTPSPTATAAPVAPAFRPSVDVMTGVFEDDFEPKRGPEAGGKRADFGAKKAETDGAVAPSSGDSLGPDWEQAGTNVWHIENGMLCGEGAHNHGVWLKRTLPVNARIEFDAMSTSPDGDLKAEVWGDGRSSAHSVSYTDATSYITIFGGWKNQANVLARINEHGRDRKELRIDPSATEPRLRPVVPGQRYHFTVERTDKMTVRWLVDGVEMLAYRDPMPLAGAGHDHFAFNDWEVKVCFDNVKVTPLP